MEPDKFVTVLTFTFPYEVAIVRGRLESEGITCFTQDELTVQVNPFYSNAIGGVKLQVIESDLERAIEILKETGYIKEEDLQPDKEKIPHFVRNDNPSNVGVACPICGSDDVIQSKKAGWLFLLTSLLFMYPAPFFNKTYYCFNCKHEFKHSKNSEKVKNNGQESLQVKN